MDGHGAVYFRLIFQFYDGNVVTLISVGFILGDEFAYGVDFIFVVVIIDDILRGFGGVRVIRCLRCLVTIRMQSLSVR